MTPFEEYLKSELERSRAQVSVLTARFHELFSHIEECRAAGSLGLRERQIIETVYSALNLDSEHAGLDGYHDPR